MARVYLLGANREIDKNIQTVQVNQIVQLEGYNYDKYVVYEITRDKWGINYKLINLKTFEFDSSELIQPLSEKFGIGIYYDDVNPRFMDAFEVALLLNKAQKKAKAAAEATEIEKKRIEEVKKVGRERLAKLIPQDAKAFIIAKLQQDDSDSQTDYFAHSTVRTVILGFSTHKKDLFSEMRKYAVNFEETAYLAEYNEEYEHREKYSMGYGFYLGESKYRGWIIDKYPFNSIEQVIEYFAYTAGDEANICIKKVVETPLIEPKTNETITGDFTIVDYSEKAIAIFGDTRPMKEQLKALGGRFNPKLTHEDEKKAGWIFSKSKEQELRDLLTSK